MVINVSEYMLYVAQNTLRTIQMRTINIWEELLSYRMEMDVAKLWWMNYGSKSKLFNKISEKKKYELVRSSHVRRTGQSTWQRCLLCNEISSLLFAIDCYVIITCNAKCENERVKYFNNYELCGPVWYSLKFAFETIYNL